MTSWMQCPVCGEVLPDDEPEARCACPKPVAPVCATCRFWAASPAASQGRCLAAEAEGAGLWATNGGTVITRPGFGCASWQGDAGREDGP